MRAKQDGAIIVISSIGALRGTPVLGAYAITKAADIQLVRNYAVENGKHGIRVNGIAPGLVKTEFAKRALRKPGRRQRRGRAHPDGPARASPTISRARRFSSPRPAASWMTGQTMVVDGGSTV